ncbi:MAG: ribosome maturation factor RimP [Candidatus Firestonebacteria bacterium]
MSNNDELVKKVWMLIEPDIRLRGLEIYDIEYKKEQMGWTLKVFLDRKGGKVGVKDCQDCSHAIDFILETSNTIEGPFCLEVSSPGLDRPLKTEKDFNRFLGQEVSVVTRVLIDRHNTFNGIIKECNSERVIIEIKSGKVEIPLKDIVRARLEIKM